jgi:putative transposase
MPKVPPRLGLIFQRYHPPLYFVTFNTYHRRKLLANGRVHDLFVAFASAGETHGIAVGRYVIMPDHIHLFIRNGSEMKISQWIRLLKRELSKEIGEPRRIGNEAFLITC